jgi:hypothetical protein
VGAVVILGQHLPGRVVVVKRVFIRYRIVSVNPVAEGIVFKLGHCIRAVLNADDPVFVIVTVFVTILVDRGVSGVVIAAGYISGTGLIVAVGLFVAVVALGGFAAAGSFVERLAIFHPTFVKEVARGD